MKIYPASEREDASCLTSLFKNPDEMAVAAWVYKNHHKAGATTDTLPGTFPSLNVNIVISRGQL